MKATRILSLLVAVWALGSTSGVLAADPARSLALTEKPEHLRPVPAGSVVRHLSGALASDAPSTSLPRARVSAAQSDSSMQFLTRPYTTWHDITSVFDHCVPDYSTDGQVCRFDGSVGYKSNGVDPGFSLGYAQTLGGSDYLYYDGHNGWAYSMYYAHI